MIRRGDEPISFSPDSGGINLVGLNNWITYSQSRRYYYDAFDNFHARAKKSKQTKNIHLLPLLYPLVRSSINKVVLNRFNLYGGTVASAGVAGSSSLDGEKELLLRNF